MRRVLFVLLTTLLFISWVPVTEAEPPPCTTASEVRAFKIINHIRTSHGLYRLKWWNCYHIDISHRHARKMANSRTLYHESFPLPDNWELWAQNVGNGLTVRQSIREMMQSPYHRENLLSKRFKRLSVGVAHSENIVYLVEDFIAP